MSDQTNEWELARLVAAMPRVPTVLASGVRMEPSTPAALLAWGRYPTGWAAGISFIHKAWRGTLVHALVTVWLPSYQVHNRRDETYGQVPRVRLAGPVEQWPKLPPLYPHAGPDWTSRHVHVVRPDPEGHYDAGPDAGRARPGA